MLTATVKFSEPPTIRVSAEVDEIPVRGNAVASGDGAFDKQVEDEILRRLAQDDVWAWACVTVTASWHGFEGRAVLGACSYESEENFKAAGDYYPEMVKEATAELQKKVEEAAAVILSDLLWKEE